MDASGDTSDTERDLPAGTDTRPPDGLEVGQNHARSLLCRTSLFEEKGKEKRSRHSIKPVTMETMETWFSKYCDTKRGAFDWYTRARIVFGLVDEKTLPKKNVAHGAKIPAGIPARRGAGPAYRGSHELANMAVDSDVWTRQIVSIPLGHKEHFATNERGALIDGRSFLGKKIEIERRRFVCLWEKNVEPSREDVEPYLGGNNRSPGKPTPCSMVGAPKYLAYVMRILFELWADETPCLDVKESHTREAIELEVKKGVENRFDSVKRRAYSSPMREVFHFVNNTDESRRVYEE